MFLQRNNGQKQKNKNMNKKIIVVTIAAIIILILVLVAVISGEKKKSEVKVIYASDQHGFTLAYPVSWKIKDSGEANMGFDANQLVPEKQKNCPESGQDCFDSIFFGVIKNAIEIKNVNDVKKLTAEKFKWPETTEIKNFKTTKIAGKKAYSFSVANPALKQNSDFVWIQLNGSEILNLTAAYLDSDQMKSFNSIIASLKFK